VLSFDRPVDRKPEDRIDDQPPLELVSRQVDAQHLMIELSETAQRLGAEAVHLLHLYETGRDLIEVNRRAKLHAAEVHLASAGVLETVEALSKALRSAGAFSTWGGR
jgi:hypothetical protein